MNPVPIKIIKLGHIEKILNFKLIEEFDSNIFKIVENTSITNIPSRPNGMYLDNVYSTNSIQEILSNNGCTGLCIAIMDYAFDDNFYMHRVGNNKICISTYGLESILQKKDISLENFILKNIYEISAFYIYFNQSLPNELYNFVHSDTRGCLFDLNGDKYNIIHNTEKPKICNDCKSKLNRNTNVDINLLEKELSKLKKPLVKTIELFIREHPLTSMLITYLISIPINLISNLIWSFLIK